jgi:choline dehydrogenase-like flavoprotein
VSIARRFPTEVDTIVIGAGTAGAVVAGRLAAGSSERTLLLEAGPDYGPAYSGRWPHDLLDATSAQNAGAAPFPSTSTGVTGSTVRSGTSTLSVIGSWWSAMLLSSGCLFAAPMLSAWP